MSDREPIDNVVARVRADSKRDRLFGLERIEARPADLARILDSLAAYRAFAEQMRDVAKRDRGVMEALAALDKETGA